MTKFMNAELVAIRDSLPCGHCKAIFQGSDSQAWKVKYEKATVYCSSICRHAALRGKFSTPVPNRGPCPVCNKTFSSRSDKVYCSVACYVASDQFAAMTKSAQKASLAPEVREKIAAKLRTGSTVCCLECGDEFYGKASRPRKFCSTSCYRSFLAKRFDRWIANPEGIALLQCYDEFLDREELTCVISGCEWHGVHLTVHMNQAHGVRSDEFKRASGFNLRTGVVAKPLAQALQQRDLRGVALLPKNDSYRLEQLAKAQEQSGRYIRYTSPESREHFRKSMTLLKNDPGPLRICSGCGNEFQQRFATGRALYCTIDCRNQTYAANRKTERKTMSGATS